MEMSRFGNCFCHLQVCRLAIPFSEYHQSLKLCACCPNLLNAFFVPRRTPISTWFRFRPTANPPLSQWFLLVGRDQHWYWLNGRYWLLLWRKDNVLLEHLLVLWVFAISLWNRWIRGVTVAFLTLDPVTLGKYYHFSLVFHFQMYLLLLCLNLYYMDYNEINWIWGNGDKFYNTFFPESHLVASASGDGTEMGVAPPHGRVFKSLLFGHCHDIHHRLLLVF